MPRHPTFRRRGGVHRSERTDRARCRFHSSQRSGFFLCPTRLVPLDRYALQGLNDLRHITGAPRLKGRSYREYLEAFNEQYAKIEHQLAAALNESSVIALADKLGCPANALSTIAIRRKLFDDYLMHSGDYLR